MSVGDIWKQKIPTPYWRMFSGRDIICLFNYLNRPPSLYVHLRHCLELSGESPTVGEQSHSLINSFSFGKIIFPDKFLTSIENV